MGSFLYLPAVHGHRMSPWRIFQRRPVVPALYRKRCAGGVRGRFLQLGRGAGVYAVVLRGGVFALGMLLERVLLRQRGDHVHIGAYDIADRRT